MSTVRFPTEHTPYIQASTRGKSIALDKELNELSSSSSFDLPGYSTVFWLHRNFLIDNGGKYINAWASLAGGIVTLIGIYLWWRVRNGFRLKQSIPKNTRSSSLLKSHIQLGLFISVPCHQRTDTTLFCQPTKSLVKPAKQRTTNLARRRACISE